MSDTSREEFEIILTRDSVADAYTKHYGTDSDGVRWVTKELAEKEITSSKAEQQTRIELEQSARVQTANEHAESCAKYIARIDELERVNRNLQMSFDYAKFVKAPELEQKLAISEAANTHRQELIDKLSNAESVADNRVIELEQQLSESERELNNYSIRFENYYKDKLALEQKNRELVEDFEGCDTMEEVRLMIKLKREALAKAGEVK